MTETQKQWLALATSEESDDPCETNESQDRGSEHKAESVGPPEAAEKRSRRTARAKRYTEGGVKKNASARKKARVAEQTKPQEQTEDGDGNEVDVDLLAPLSYRVWTLTMERTPARPTPSSARARSRGGASRSTSR